MRITKATLAELSLLVDLGRSTYVHHFGDLWSEAALRDWLDAQFDPERLAHELDGSDVRYYLVWHDDRLIGFAKAKLDRPVPTQASAGMELEKIYFLPEATGRGYGSRLIQHVLAEATAIGQPLVWLDVMKTNARGKAMYERHGFETVAELPFATDLREVGFWLMVRHLP